jgi:hypothetical protein
MGPMFKELFDEHGAVLGSPNANCVRLIRQACYFFYKFDTEYPPDLEAKTIQSFVEVDESLTHVSEKFEDLTREQRLVVTIASFTLERVFSNFDPADIAPRPGPGASASGTCRAERYEPKVLFSRIHESYPYYRYFYMGRKHLLDRASTYRALPRKEAGTSLLRLVPKDSRGPRIICMEEQEYMFLQQGLGDALRRHVESDKMMCGHVNFRDQSINRQLALRSSVTREYATLDMKEASDRISRNLVFHLFARCPDLRRCLLALSTPEIRLPDGKVIQARKFAPMGSSLCFPIMSVVHYVLALAAIHVATAHPIKAIAKSVYVYGDDIIVSTEYVDPLFRTFPLFGLMFNTGKSFRAGSFRESCGMDAFQGWDVSPQRLKRRFFDGQDPRNISAVMDIYRLLNLKGFAKTSRALRSVVTRRYGAYPLVAEKSPFLGYTVQESAFLSDDFLESVARISPTGGNYRKVRIQREWSIACEGLDLLWDVDLQTMTTSARVMKTEPEASMLGGWEQLMRANLHTLQGSEHLDGRWSRQEIVYQRVPYRYLISAGSNWLPRVIIRH